MSMQIFRSLAHRNYRLFFAGQGISLIGTWMQQIAMTWLVYRLTDSPFLLGIVGFSSQIPAFLFSSFAGVVADRWDRRRILVVTQSLSMAQALAAAILTLSGIITVWQIITLSLIIGLINAFDIPARQAFVVQMVGRKEDLPNAIALNSSLFNGARLIGPSIAGILVAVLGEGICFLLNTVSYVAVITALMMMQLVPGEQRASDQRVLQRVKEGFRYAFGFPPIRSILLLLALTSIMAMHLVLMPVFAREIFHGGPQALGALMASIGVGALAGAAYLASRSSILGLDRIIAFASGLVGIGLVAFAISRMFWFSLAMLAVTGFATMIQMASSNTILQTIADDDKRGRVMSLYAMAFMGMAPIGSLLGGSLAGSIGAPGAVLTGGIVCVLGSLAFARRLPVLRASVRPTYLRLGILPSEKHAPKI